jgi:hypothetical protein
MVSVEEVPYLPETIEEIREDTGVAARRFYAVLNRAREVAEARGVELHTHVLAGHPVRDIVNLAACLRLIARRRRQCSMPATRAPQQNERTYNPRVPILAR